MHQKGHIGAALLAYAPIGAVTLALGIQRLAVLGAVAAVGLAMVPDWDQRVPLIAHRGPTHTVWFAGLVGLVLGGITAVVAGSVAAVFALLVGVVTVGSHILADALTPMGVRPFAPIRTRRYTLGLVRAANPVANYLLLVLGVIAIAGAYVVGSTIGG